MILGLHHGPKSPWSLATWQRVHCCHLKPCLQIFTAGRLEGPCHPGQLKSPAQSSGYLRSLRALSAPVASSWESPCRTPTRPEEHGSSYNSYAKRCPKSGFEIHMVIRTYLNHDTFWGWTITMDHGIFDSFFQPTMIPFVPSKNCWQDGWRWLELPGDMFRRKCLNRNQITRQNPYDCKSFGIEGQYSIHIIRI